MPALTITLTLENKISERSFLDSVQNSSNNDLVTFVSGLLLGNDQQARSWFSLFIRQKVNFDNLEYKKYVILYLIMKYILFRE